MCMLYTFLILPLGAKILQSPLIFHMYMHAHSNVSSRIRSSCLSGLAEAPLHVHMQSQFKLLPPMCKCKLA